MSFTVRVTKTTTEGSMSISNSVSYTVQTSFKMQESIADSVTDQEHLIAIDVSALKAFTMQSTQDLLVETNSGGSPQETFNLVANVPVIWELGDPAIFSGDITAIYLTNTSGAAAQFNLIAGVDV